MNRVAIIFGFSEGWGKAKHLAPALAMHGFTITDDLAHADAIITHSGGCTLLPTDCTAKAVLMVAPTIGPAANTPISTQARRMQQELAQYGFWRLAAKNSRNAVSLLVHPARNWRMAQRIKRSGGTVPNVPSARLAVVCSHGDPWTTSLPPSDVARLRNHIFINHPGGHDDIWDNPESYVRILEYICHKNKTPAARRGGAPRTAGWPTKS